ncbi:hypothetical protein LINPERPRIM_LOCUS32414 [Linum perenne]
MWEKMWRRVLLHSQHQKLETIQHAFGHHITFLSSLTPLISIGDLALLLKTGLILPRKARLK